MLLPALACAQTNCRLIMAGPAPYLQGAPVIVGANSADVGQVFTITPGVWQNCVAPDCVISHQWKWSDTGAAISGATGASYTAVAADVGHSIQVVETATNSGGNASVTSQCY
jgi:hypothetical protein